MKLDGGLKEYIISSEDIEFKRHNSDIPPKGRKVKFINEGGYECDLEYANKFFKEGQILTVSEIYVGRSYSKVEFKECEGKSFNTVMFKDID